MADLFNNPSNDYIYPGLSPCPNVADDQYLAWTKNGLAIIKGSQEIATLDFSDLAIPIASFNKQQLILEGGAVAFIPGLTKGLCYRQQGFLFPSLTSTDEDLNPYFFKIDLSINYYKNFSFVYSNIDVSSDYGQNISIEDALSISLSEAGIKVTASYDPSIITFSGTQEGYEFNISNVFLTIIDTSQNVYSPFANGANAPSYDLVEDPSADIPFAKYPNTAMQGIALKGIYPIDSDIMEEDKWVYLNHVSDYVITYDQVSVNYDSDVSVGSIIEYDLSTYLGVYPVISMGDVSISGMTIDSCILSDTSIKNSIITDSSIVNSFVLDSSVYTSYLEDISIGNSLIVECPIVNSRIITSIINNPDISINQSVIWDTSIYSGVIYDSSIFRTYLEDVSLLGCTLYNCSYDASVDISGNRELLVDASIGCIYEIIADTSIFYLKHRKRLEVGMSGCSVGEIISAGDYLNMITINDLWKKVGEMYIWTSTSDLDCTTRNLIDGFYVFNPHDFTLKLEYLVFV